MFNKSEIIARTLSEEDVNVVNDLWVTPQSANYLLSRGTLAFLKKIGISLMPDPIKDSSWGYHNVGEGDAYYVCTEDGIKGRITIIYNRLRWGDKDHPIAFRIELENGTIILAGRRSFSENETSNKDKEDYDEPPSTKRTEFVIEVIQSLQSGEKILSRFVTSADMTRISERKKWPHLQIEMASGGKIDYDFYAKESGSLIPKSAFKDLSMWMYSGLKSDLSAAGFEPDYHFSGETSIADADSTIGIYDPEEVSKIEIPFVDGFGEAYIEHTEKAKASLAPIVSTEKPKGKSKRKKGFLRKRS